MSEGEALCSGAWGVELSPLTFERKGRAVEERFKLELPALAITAGVGGLDRVPIMGVSGAGKSTLLNLLAGVIWPTSSNAKIRWRFPDGTTIEWGPNGPPSDQLTLLRKQYFGYSFQSAMLQPHLTIRENLAYPLEALGLSHKEAMAEARKRLKPLFDVRDSRLDSVLDRFASTPSGGEKQRVALMQALVRDPPVLFADEPTGSLDPATRTVVMEVLRDWLDEGKDKRLLIWVTHHETDPADNGADHRLFVGPKSGWQRLVGNSWDWEVK